MSQAVALAVHVREGKGTRIARKLRDTGMIPGIVYGHKEVPVQVTVSAKEFNHAVRVLKARTIEIVLGGKKETVLIKDLQFDYLSKHIVHFDLLRVSASDTVNPFAAIPSLHSAEALMVTVFLWHFTSKWLRPLLLALPLAMAFTLVYSGEHYLIDVFVGWAMVAIGLALGGVLCRRYGWKNPWVHGPKLDDTVGPRAPAAAIVRPEGPAPIVSAAVRVSAAADGMPPQT